MPHKVQYDDFHSVASRMLLFSRTVPHNLLVSLSCSCLTCDSCFHTHMFYGWVRTEHSMKTLWEPNSRSVIHAAGVGVAQWWNCENLQLSVTWWLDVELTLSCKLWRFLSVGHETFVFSNNRRTSCTRAQVLTCSAPGFMIDLNTLYVELPSSSGLWDGSYDKTWLSRLGVQTSSQARTTSCSSPVK